MDPLARRRFARQLLLAEIGEAGQARLCASRVKMAEGADAQAGETARAYLERAGLQVVAERTAVEAAVPSAAAIAALARSEMQRPAAAALAGAFAAVEAIKAALALQPRAALPADLFDFEATS